MMSKQFGLTSSHNALVMAGIINTLDHVCRSAHAVCIHHSLDGYISWDGRTRVSAKGYNYLIKKDDRTIEIPDWIGCHYFSIVHKAVFARLSVSPPADMDRYRYFGGNRMGRATQFPDLKTQSLSAPIHDLMSRDELRARIDGDDARFLIPKESARDDFEAVPVDWSNDTTIP
jgi:hypothetical protein